MYLCYKVSRIAHIKQSLYNVSQKLHILYTILLGLMFLCIFLGVQDKIPFY